MQVHTGLAELSHCTSSLCHILPWQCCALGKQCLGLLLS